MYIWNVNALVEDLKANRVSSREQFKYLVFFTILMCISLDPYIHTGRPYTLYNFLITLGTISIAVWGFCHCYAKNHAGDDADFLMRISCLSIPVFVRYFVLFLILVVFFTFTKVIYGILTGAESVYDQFGKADATDVVFVLSTQFIYYLYLGSKMGEVATQAKMFCTSSENH